MQAFSKQNGRKAGCVQLREPGSTGHLRAGDHSRATHSLLNSGTSSVRHLPPSEPECLWNIDYYGLEPQLKITEMNMTRFLPFGSHSLTGKTTHKKAILNETTEAPWYTRQQFPRGGAGD